MVDFAKLRSNRGSTLSKLTEKLETLNKGSSTQKDERLYKPGFDKKEGKGYAVIRFLPAKEGEHFVRVFSHAFKGKDGWYIENSRSTIGEEDPVGIANTLYWKKGENEGNESFKNIARARKRNTKYFANVYVIKDTVSTDWNGKNAIYEFGGQIFKKIEAAAKPEFEDDQPMDPFDLWSGADFKIKIVGKEIPDQRNGGKTVVPNYENSEFDRVSELFEGDDAKKEELFGKTYDLSEFLKVKTFEELAVRFKKVTGEAHNKLESGDPAESVAARLEKQADLDTNVDNGDDAAGKSVDEAPEQTSSSDAVEGESVLDMFKRMAEQA
jgi:hypothetical protein